MHQLTQNLKSGKMEISEVPVPALETGCILVRNHFSLISAGTEGSKVSTARKSLWGKAKEKPEQVKQVLDTIKKEGVFTTYRKVMNKLDSLSPLGYSSAGIVEAVGAGVTGFQVGDRVSCSGADIANHADMVAVPINLACKIPENVSIASAAYTTVATIALQGIRVADLRLGEVCAVIGLGLIGQLTVQMLKAAGIRVIGIDVNPQMAELALKSGADLAFARSSAGIEQSALNLSGGYGVDAVIITAGTSSLDPVEFAGKLCRPKGKVIIVGAVPTGFSRDGYYKKELELRMATSYGPGRYNPNYEEKGYDYPIAYVRWTENRNMQAFLQMVSEGKVNTELLTTHTFDFAKADEAYQLIMDRVEPFTGILLKYDTQKVIDKNIQLRTTSANSASKLKISFIGAGAFAQNSLLPNIKDAEMVSVATSSGHTAKNVAQKYGFAKASCQAAEVAAEKESNTIFIATRHDLHAEFVLQAIKNGKNVFVEKPLCLTEDEFSGIVAEYKKQNVKVMVGFNRRFAPQVQKIKKQLPTNQPIAINYRINAGAIPADHWIQDLQVGGGRIIGEVCHFVDLAMFLAGSLPAAVNAMVMNDPLGLNDTLAINLSFKNGSIASVTYFANGSKELKKEYLEVFAAGQTSIVDDFKEMHLYGKGHSKSSLFNQDKGHSNEVAAFLNSIKDGKECPISFEEIYWSTSVTFDIINSIKEKRMIVY